MLGSGLGRGGVFHQIQNLGYGGVPKLPGGADFQHTGKVNAAADNLVSRLHLPGQAFSCEGAGVQGGGAGYHSAVNGHLLSGIYHNDAANGNLLRVGLHQGTVHPDVGIVRADVHESRNVSPALSHGVALEQLTYLIKEHDGDGLHVISRPGEADEEGSHSSHRHEKVLVQQLPMGNPNPGLPENVIADEQIGDKV